MSYYILVINFGSTSTKIAAYENTQELFKVSVSHSPEETEQFHSLEEQFDF